jgi:FAD/FMN-containing dehydrogenase
MSPIQIRKIDGGSAALDNAQLTELERGLDGRLLRPQTPGWNEATLSWNGMAARIPALVVQPGSAAGVSAVLRFARDKGLLTSVRGGGHNIAGTSIAAGGIVLDMARMRSVTVDPEDRLAHVGPGCVLGDVDEATQEHGLATVLGFVSETGVAGLTLGGGWGYLTRRFGWTVDNLQEVEIVTADGAVRIANADQHEDLFWAIRGGSGNFGVVTRFSYRLHRVGPMVTGGLIAWSAERADEVLGAYRKMTANAPPELTVAAIIRLAPPAPFMPQPWHGKPVVALVVCYSGDDPAAALSPIRAIGEPIANTIQPLPYTKLQSMLNAMEPKGLHRYWKTEFLPGLTGEFLQAFREGALAVSSPLSQSVIFHLGGALNERDDAEGAVGNRDARFITGFSGTWMPETPANPHIDWVKRSWEQIRRHSTGGNYVNFQLQDDDEERLQAAYGKNLKRLREIKATYDPDNFFRVNRNISPAR